jgi:TolB protein
MLSGFVLVLMALSGSAFSFLGSGIFRGNTVAPAAQAAGQLGDSASSQPSTQGEIAFARGGSSGGIYTMNASGSDLTMLSSDSGDTQPAWSPDGSRIAFVRFDKGNADIYIMRPDGTEATQLTSDGADSSPTWSPDGSKIMFARETGNGESDLYEMGVDGGKATQVTSDSLSEYYPNWSPDGTSVAFAGYDVNRTMRVYVMNPDRQWNRPDRS